MKTPSSKKPSSKPSRPGAAKPKCKPADVDADVIEAEVIDFDEDEPDEDDADEDSEPAPKYERQETSGKAEGFFDTLGGALRSAGETAQRYTRIGVSHAEIEKLRYDLKTAHADLGEVVMRCWADAPDLGLTARDPAIQQAVKRVKEVRRAIREKEAKIAQLKKE